MLHFPYTREEKEYIDRSMSEVHGGTVDMFQFNNEREFIKTVRMPLLKFFQLVDILYSRSSLSVALSKMKKKNIIYATCVVLNRLGTVYDHSYSVAERFKLAEVSLRTYTENVLQAILRIFTNPGAFTKRGDNNDDSDSDLEEGEIRTAPKKERCREVMGITTIRLHYKPVHQLQDYMYEDKLMSTKEFGVRVLAAVSPTQSLLRVIVCRPAIQSEGELFTQSAMFDNPCHVVSRSGQCDLPMKKEIGVPAGPDSKALVQCITTRWLAGEKPAVSSHKRLLPSSAYRRRVGVHAVEQTFDAWKTVFRSLDGLPVRIRNPKSLAFVSDWITATGYIYSFLNPDEKYVELLRHLDEEDVTICTPLFDVERDSNLSDSGEEEEVAMDDEDDKF